MGIYSRTEYGYGYKLENENNLENIKEFLIKNRDNVIKNGSPLSDGEIVAISDAKDLEGIHAITDDPVVWIIANIINKLEGRNDFKGYPAGEDSDDTIGIEPSYPWQSKSCTREECDALLKKYADELGITEEPGYFDVEYCA